MNHAWAGGKIGGGRKRETLDGPSVSDRKSTVASGSIACFFDGVLDIET